MSKKQSILTVTDDLSDLFVDPSKKQTPRNIVENSAITRRITESITIKDALKTIIRQMQISGNRPRTINDYEYHVNHFINVTRLSFLHEISADYLYEWLASMDVSNQTKLTRLKCLKAFLGRCFDNGWLPNKFWKKVKVKVDNNIKEGATEKDVNILLSVLDLNDFVELRDATAALLMYKTGIRINTITHLENKHIDFSENLLRLDGSIMKNHKELLLPFDDTLHRMLAVLVKHNEKIRRAYGENNNYVFITSQGKIVANSPTNNNIQKRLKKYAVEYGLKNISPHALRRGFAKSLLDKGANITDISHALGHSNLAVTTKYLYLDKEEVAENLRKFL